MRRWSAPAVGGGLGLPELALVRQAGPPGRQIEVLHQLSKVGADPLASLLALLALAAQGLAAYLLAVLGLRLLATVPGAIGRLAAGATVLATPATVRRALDLLLGGAGWRRRPSRPSPPERPPLPRRRPPLPRPRPPPSDRCPPGRAGRQPVRRGRGPGRPCRRGWRSSGPDPDLIHRGTRLLVPPYRPDRR
jgi:hypothetical protein